MLGQTPYCPSFAEVFVQHDGYNHDEQDEQHTLRPWIHVCELPKRIKAFQMYQSGVITLCCSIPTYRYLH
jgi:hypothetical protein